MLVIAIFVVVGLVIALSRAAQRSNVEDVTANNKPSDDDAKQSNERELSRSRSVDRAREMVHETDRAELTDPQPTQNHIHYLEQTHIRLMLDRAEKERAEKSGRYESILRHLLGTELDRNVDKTPLLEHDKSRERSRSR
jgi:hypothetical protein